MTSTPSTSRSKTFRLTAIGVAATTLCVGSAGFVAAANPASAFGQAVGTAVHAAGVDWSDMPAGYTQAQYEAFWGAEYSGEDLVELQALWSLDETETKSRAGQMILDGEQLPFEPGAHTTPKPSTEEIAANQAYIDSGHTSEDLAALSALWNVDEMEAKVRAGEILLAGKELPLP
ncbi:hypothetical protein [Promicromonospora kroppenstedtii]|uniref:hypothetical protein n=1 Tax=Promicromonospora kroppenstedtii TaxID=440482 RepID=UPI0004B1E375|nr:hypothetical protein [Promicromonospora kroppenstedtii]